MFIMTKLNESDFCDIAKEYHIDALLLKTLCKVETGGKGGFIDNGRAVILFEGHVFWRELKRAGINPAPYGEKFPNIVYPQWDKNQYRGGTAEYLRLTMAQSINKVAALRSTSWGMFQIMGFNFPLCNESTIDGFVTKMNESEAAQLRLSLNYIVNAGILPLLNNHQWSEFAKLYNGKEYKENKYDQKLRDTYEKYLNKVNTTPQ